MARRWTPGRGNRIAVGKLRHDTTIPARLDPGPPRAALGRPLERHPLCIPYGALVECGGENLLTAGQVLQQQPHGPTRHPAASPLILNIGQAAGAAAALQCAVGVPRVALPLRPLQTGPVNDPGTGQPVPLGAYPLGTIRSRSAPARALADQGLDLQRQVAGFVGQRGRRDGATARGPRPKVQRATCTLMGAAAYRLDTKTQPAGPSSRFELVLAKGPGWKPNAGSLQFA